MVTNSSRPQRILQILFALVAVVVALFPVAWLAWIATRSPVQALRLPPDLLSTARFDVFAEVWMHSGFARSFLNSAIITCLGVLISLAIGIPAAYKLSRMKQRGDALVNFWLVAVYALPPFLFAIPLFALYQAVGLFDTHLGLAVVNQVLVLPLAIWLLRSFFDGIPLEIDEAAFIDGASRGRILWSIHLPLLRPGIATASILAAIIIWNELTLALSLSFSNAKPISLVVASFRGYGSANWTEVAAASLIALAPTLLLAVFAQRFIVKGLSAGAGK